MSDGLEDYMAKPTQDDLADPQELRDARAEDRERAIDEARTDAQRAMSNLRRTEIRFYRYRAVSRDELLQAKQDALSARARLADLEEGS